jgi:hypothetical protein
VDPNSINYVDACKRFEQAAKALNDTVALLSEFMQKVGNDPGKVFFTNTAVPAPSDVTMATGYAGIDSKRWPSADQIQALLSEWFEAKQLAQRLYKLVPADERTLVPKVP